METNVLRRSDVEGRQAKENRCRFLLGDGENDQQPRQHRTDTSLQGGGGGPRSRVGSKGSLLHGNCSGEPAVKLGWLLGRRRAPIQPASIFSEEKKVGRGVGGREERRCEDFSLSSRLKHSQRPQPTFSWSPRGAPSTCFNTEQAQSAVL